MAASTLQLDELQRAVIELPADASGVVIGAPGTGKTTALVERVAHLVDAGLEPDQVLVITGSRQTSAELRDVIALRLNRTTSGPVARTVASVAFDLVQAQLGRPVTLLTGAEHDGFISDLINGEIEDDTDGYWPSTLSRELRQLAAFRTELREFMMRTEEYGVSVARLRALADERQRPEWLAVAEFVERAVVPKAATFADQFDAAELVAFAARLVHDGANVPGHVDLRAILIDDAQDATESTISLLRAFASRGVAVLAFGDPDIASNGFRGGRTDLLGQFAQQLRLSGTVSMWLPNRYRTPSRIRSEYARLVAAIGARGAVQHREPSGEIATTDDGQWRRLLSPSAYTEARVIAEELRSRHLLDQVAWSDMAVVTRSMQHALSLERTLGRLGVPTQRTISRVLLRDNISARWLLDAAQVAYEFNDSDRFDAQRRREQLFELLASPLGGFDQIELRRFKLELRDADVDLVSAIRHPTEFDAIPTRLAARAAELARTLNTAATAARTGSIEDVFWDLWSRSPASTLWLSSSAERGAIADEANASLDAVVSLFAAAKRFVERRPNEHGLVFLHEQYSMAVPEDVIVGSRSNDTVVIATPSQLVGREFDTVIVASLNDGVWPNLRPRFSILHADDLPRALDHEPATADHAAARVEVRSDEYRLFALAISRASQRVVLSAHTGDEARPSVLFGPTDGVEIAVRKPTRLRDLAAELRRQLVRATESKQPVSTAAASQAAAALSLLANERVAGANPDDWYGLREWSTTRPVFDVVGDGKPIKVSPSAIEKLEESSMAWFVDAFAPAPTGDAQALGIIVHAAFETLAQTPDATVDDYLELVLPELEKLPVQAEWMRGQVERESRVMLGKLEAYVRDSAAKGRSVVGAEMKFTITDDAYFVSGIIDRVEQTADGKIYVVDLKTGKTPPSAKKAAENAQMQCYQLAVHVGGLRDIEGPRPLEGASLLYIRDGNQGPTLRNQEALTDDTAQVVQDRIRAAAERMNAERYDDYLDIDSFSPSGNRRYRIQVIPAVSE